MSEQILLNHESLENAHTTVCGLIDKIRTLQQTLQNADSALIDTWIGNGANAFSGLSNENHSIFLALIENAETINNELLQTNQAFEESDNALAGSMGGAVNGVPMQ